MFAGRALHASRACGSAAARAPPPRRLMMLPCSAPVMHPPPPAGRRTCHTTTSAPASSAAAAGPSAAPPGPAAPGPQAAGADSLAGASSLSAVHERFRGRTCLVQGTSRGLGLEFVRQLLEVPDTTVVATCRSPAAAEQLRQLQQQQQQQQQQQRGRHRLHVVQLDVCDDGSIQRAAEEVSELVPSLDLLINCSAVLHGPQGMTPETSYTRIRGDHMALSFATNAIGPIMVCRSFLPLLLRSPGASQQQPALLANMSARVGSLGDNRLGGWYSYRASKAALNQMSLTLSLELQRKRAAAAVVMLHPGTCDTDLSRPYHKNVPPGKLFDRSRGVRQLLGILAGLGVSDSGRFIAWDGQDVPW